MSSYTKPPTEPSSNKNVDLTLAHYQPVDGHTLANTLRVRPGTLWYFTRFAYTQYTRQFVKKKSGGTRTLHVPSDGLAWLQRRILHTYLNRIDYPEHVSAYVCGRSIRDAAEKHSGRPLLLVMDIKDFFPTTRRSCVRNALKHTLQVPTEVAEILATLTTAPTVPGVNKQFIVPQGAPTSGAVANLVAMQRLDPPIIKICTRYKLTYTRYADDMAFSSETPLKAHDVSSAISELIHAVHCTGYRINHKKTRVQRKHRRQHLLGMTINQHPNYPKSQYRTLRALVHNCATHGYAATATKYGYESPEALVSYLTGLLNYVEGLAPTRTAALRAQLPD